MIDPQNKLKFLVMASAAFFAFTAFAQAKDPELSFYPAGDWHVTKGATCLISSEFNNGFVFEFGGGTDGLQALSIDFRQSAFESGKDYNVNVSVPGLVEKTVNGEAADGQVLRVDMKGHDDVLYAAGKSGMIDVGVEDNHFRFYLVGFAENSKDFNSCMNIKAGVPVMAKSEEAPVSSAPADENIVVSTSGVKANTVVKAIPLEDDAKAPAPKAEEKPADVKKDTEIKYVMKGEEDKSDLEHIGIPEDSKIKVKRDKYEVNADFTDAAQLQKENMSLKNELNTALADQRQEQLSISAENWDLERATARYNEAELQIKTLGQKLQRERTQCTMEKKELEAMLFDPQVTSAQQQAKLAELEQQLTNAQKELDMQRVRYDERIKALESQLQAQ